MHKAICTKVQGKTYFETKTQQCRSNFLDFLLFMSFWIFDTQEGKDWSTLLSFISKYVLPCTFVQMALCIYEHSLFPLHSYHCGRNLEIFVTIVNRSSTLLWMISEWFCWSWDMHRLVSIYLPTLYFIVFAKRAHQM